MTCFDQQAISFETGPCLARNFSTCPNFLSVLWRYANERCFDKGVYFGDIVQIHSYSQIGISTFIFLITGTGMKTPAILHVLLDKIVPVSMFSDHIACSQKPWTGEINQLPALFIIKRNLPPSPVYTQLWY